MKCSDVEFYLFELHTKTISSGKVKEDNLDKCLIKLKNEPLLLKGIRNESIIKIQNTFKFLSKTVNSQHHEGFIKNLKKIEAIKEQLNSRLYTSGYGFYHNCDLAYEFKKF